MHKSHIGDMPYPYRSHPHYENMSSLQGKEKTKNYTQHNGLVLKIGKSMQVKASRATFTSVILIINEKWTTFH